MALAFAITLAGLGSPAAAAVVNRIDVDGNQRVDDDTVRAYVLIQPGVSFTPQDVDDSVKALFDTGLFSDAQINQRGPVLLVEVVENPIINDIAFEGNKKFKDEQLLAVIQSEPGGVFTRTTVQGDVQRILELLRRSGRYQASVTPKTIQLPNGGINLVFEIADGPNTGISGITFIGNQAYSDDRLRNVITTRESGILGFLRSGDQYDPDRLAADEERLRDWYLNRGYADFRVVSAVADLDRERNTFFITFTVEEGPRYRFGAIGVDSTIGAVDTAELQRIASTEEGEVFSNQAIEQSTEAMTLRLAALGHPFAQVRARLDRNPIDLTIGVTYVVDEGARNYVERLDVRGNARSRDYIVRREFDIAEGDPYNRVLINRAERRLRNLGYFSDVRITTEPGSTPDRVVVVANVVEQPTGEFSFGAGYSTSDGIVGDVSLSERNFLGRGYNMRIGAGGGSDSRNYEFSFTDPYFLGRRVSAGFNVYRREYNDNDFRSYDYDKTGAGLDFGFPITENFSVHLGYNLEYQDIDIPDYDLDDDIDGTNDDEDEPGLDCIDDVSLAICQAEGESVVSSVSYSLVYDSLDNRRDPHDGIYAKFTQEFAGVGGDVSFLRTTGSAAYYQELLADAGVVGFVKVQGGHIAGIGEEVRLLDAFFKGGETVRGFESSGFGPRDLETEDALGGTVYMAGTAEVQFPLPMVPQELGLKAAVFADAGTLFNSDVEEEDFSEDIEIGDSATLRSSVGGSILWASPVGPIRADFAYVLTSEDYDEEQFFRVGGGARF
ncbi:MAG TPA: outer membrane protein assembly factor BamA [Propylenella sp.]|nr:outer membrane protein assembly factor BamA [Propylenella sp.]